MSRLEVRLCCQFEAQLEKERKGKTSLQRASVVEGSEPAFVTTLVTDLFCVEMDSCLREETVPWVACFAAVRPGGNNKSGQQRKVLPRSEA